MKQVLEARVKEVQLERANYFEDLKESVKANDSSSFQVAYDEARKADI